ncbi:hypothetical protein GCM10023350_37310 [Nocardioides endophyticus]|uniref:Uncharacterized protein n=1 Tax=Nocardioides endophyticus TaxID=1353775 RepID=A0ABP8Z7P2_9ACTN
MLLAPTEQVAEFVATTYTLDEVRIEPIALNGWVLSSPSLALDLILGGRTGLGRLLRMVPRRLAESPAWCSVTNPVARVALRGVRTRGAAGNDRREWYGATDVREVVAMSGTFDGHDLGRLTPVDPPPRAGFSSTPTRPSVTTVSPRLLGHFCRFSGTAEAQNLRDTR